MDLELKQYLDEKFTSIDRRFEIVNRQFETVATKYNLTEQTETLKAYANDQTEKLAVIIKDTIVEPMEKRFAELKDYKTVQEKVLTLEADMREIKTALHLG